MKVEKMMCAAVDAYGPAILGVILAMFIYAVYVIIAAVAKWIYRMGKRGWAKIKAYRAQKHAAVDI